MASGFFANLKPYYTMFWRLNRLQIDPPVADYLRHNVKSDALIYFDEFPMSTQNTIVNPLTKDLRYEDAAAMIRDHVVPRQGKNDLLFYNLSWEEFNGFIAGRDVDFWVVTKLDNAGCPKKKPRSAGKPWRWIPAVPNSISPWQNSWEDRATLSRPRKNMEKPSHRWFWRPHLPGISNMNPLGLSSGKTKGCGGCAFWPGTIPVSRGR